MPFRSSRASSVYHVVVTAAAAEEKPPSFICTGLRRFRFAESTVSLPSDYAMLSQVTVVARLVTTNPRPKSTQQAMAQVVHDVLRTAIESEQRPYWWHRYVLIEPLDRQDYLKTDSRVLEDQRTLDQS